MSRRGDGRSDKLVARRGGLGALTLFGLVAVTSMLVCYACEGQGRGWVLGFAGSCALGSAYGFMQRAWPVVVEPVWSLVALKRWLNAGRPPAR